MPASHDAGVCDTNRGLFLFGLFLVLLAITFGYYPISLLGLLFLVASFFSGQAKPAPSRTPAPTGTPARVRRPQPLPTPKPEPGMPGPEKAQPQVSRDVMTHYAPPTPEIPTQMPSQQPFQMTQPSVVIPPLFPTTMFPAISPPSLPSPAKAEEQKGEKREERDELVEAIAALAVLRILTQGT